MITKLHCALLRLTKSVLCMERKKSQIKPWSRRLTINAYLIHKKWNLWLELQEWSCSDGRAICTQLSLPCHHKTVRWIVTARSVIWHWQMKVERTQLGTEALEGICIRKWKLWHVDGIYLICKPLEKYKWGFTEMYIPAVTCCSSISLLFQWF